ncbi:MAG: sigma-70 family RNA polymerase sigma factor [Bacteroidales bacterium]
MEKIGSKHIDDSLSDAELIELAKKKENLAYSILFNRYRIGLTNYLSKYLGPKDVEDITQECMIKAYLALGSYNFKYSFSTWLFSIGRNAAIDLIRKTSNKSTLEIEETSTDIIIDNSNSNPEEHILSNEAYYSIVNQILKLNPTYRTVAKLRFLDGYAYEEIAKELNLSINTVKTRLRRAKEILLQKNHLWK